MKRYELMSKEQIMKEYGDGGQNGELAFWLQSEVHCKNAPRYESIKSPSDLDKMVAYMFDFCNNIDTCKHCKYQKAHESGELIDCFIEYLKEEIEVPDEPWIKN